MSAKTVEGITGDELIQSQWYRSNVISLTKKYESGTVLAIKNKNVVAVGDNEIELRTRLASEISAGMEIGVSIIFRRIP